MRSSLHTKATVVIGAVIAISGCVSTNTLTPIGGGEALKANTRVEVQTPSGWAVERRSSSSYQVTFARTKGRESESISVIASRLDTSDSTEAASDPHNFGEWLFESEKLSVERVGVVDAGIYGKLPVWSVAAPRSSALVVIAMQKRTYFVTYSMGTNVSELRGELATIEGIVRSVRIENP